MSTWTFLHRYNRLAEENKVVPLACPDCEQEFAWVIGDDDEPVAWCPMEDKKFYPGKLFWGQVQREVLEHWDV